MCYLLVVFFTVLLNIRVCFILLTVLVSWEIMLSLLLPPRHVLV